MQDRHDTSYMHYIHDALVQHIHHMHCPLCMHYTHYEHQPHSVDTRQSSPHTSKPLIITNTTSTASNTTITNTACTTCVAHTTPSTRNPNDTRLQYTGLHRIILLRIVLHRTIWHYIRARRQRYPKIVRAARGHAGKCLQKSINAYLHTYMHSQHARDLYLLHCIYSVLA